MIESTDTPRPVDEAYRRLPTEGPDEPDLGGALITWVEPMAEHVVAYNRWYEDDHMITGAMSMPWMFSCRRWVAPTWIQHLRGPADSAVADCDRLASTVKPPKNPADTFAAPRPMSSWSGSIS